MGLGEQLSYELIRFAYIGEANYRDCPYDPDNRQSFGVDSVTVSDPAIAFASAADDILIITAVSPGKTQIDVWMRATGLGEFYAADVSERLTIQVAVLE